MLEPATVVMALDSRPKSFQSGASGGEFKEREFTLIRGLYIEPVRRAFKVRICEVYKASEKTPLGNFLYWQQAQNSRSSGP